MSTGNNVDEISNSELQDWVEKAKRGESDAFRHIFELMNDQLFSYALSHTKSRDEAMDLVQETFIELWNALRKFRYLSRQQFYGFTYVILKRRLYRYYRRALTSVELEERFIADSYDMEVEDYRFLEKMIKKLPERYQELIRLRYWGELSFQEIAGCLNVKESTAKVWHHRAVRSLGSHLQGIELR